MPSPGEVYWAAKDGLELAADAYERVRRFYQELPQTVRYKRWSKAYRTFYGLSGEEDPFDISRAMQVGDKGQLTSIKVNHAGSIARRAQALVSQTIPEFEIVPTNDDYDSVAQAGFGKKLLNYYMDTAGVGGLLIEAAQVAVIFAQGSLEVAWDPFAGPVLQARTNPDGTPMLGPDGQPAPPDPMMPTRKNAGDLVFRVFTPLDMVVDAYRYDDQHDWTITRRFVSRWDLAARYPGAADEILGFRESNRFPGTQTNSIETERDRKADVWSDLISLYTLYHRKTEALPQGKIAHFLSEDIFLWGGNLPYEEVPLVSISPGKMVRTPHGDSGLHHVLGLQDVLDNVASSIASNNIALATHIVMIPKGVEYDYRELGEGLAALEVETGPDGKHKPEVLSLNGSNEHAMAFVEFIIKSMETIYGISSTLRGNPQANIQSGAFAALVAQQALEYAGAFQYSFQQAVGKTGNLIIDILQQYADQPRVIEIAGKGREYQRESFTKAKLEGIHRVTVKSGNPAARTPAFNIAAADALLQRGIITNTKDYLSVMRTGQLDVMVEDDEANLMRIRQENELLATGENPQVVSTDSHRLDIKHHNSVIGSPGARKNPAVVKATLDHIQAHIDQLRNADPALLNLIGETPLPPAPPPMPPPGAPAQPMPQQPQGGPPGMPGHQPGPAPVPPSFAPGPLPKQPNMPKNPLTGHPATPHDGAISNH